MSIERKYCKIHELKEYDRFTKKDYLIDKNKVEEEISQIQKRLVPQVMSSYTLSAELQMLKDLYPYNNDSFLKIVSGKDYIIPYLKRYIGKQIGFKFQLPNESWKFHFVQYCDMKRLESLKRAIVERVNTNV